MGEIVAKRQIFIWVGRQAERNHLTETRVISSSQDSELDGNLSNGINHLSRARGIRHENDTSGL